MIPGVCLLPPDECQTLAHSWVWHSLREILPGAVSEAWLESPQEKGKICKFFMSSLKWKKLRNANKLGLVITAARSCAGSSSSQQPFGMVTVGQSAGTHTLGNASVPALLSCTVLAVPRAQPGHRCHCDLGARLLLASAMVQARRKHTAASPWEKPHHLLCRTRCQQV